MARIDWVEQRLRDWAQWLRVGDGSGYPAKSVLHPHWSLPSAGTTPTLKVTAPSSARATHRAIGRLSERLQATVVLHYCTQLSVVDQASRLECQPDTIGQRLRTAHSMLARDLGAALPALGGFPQ